MGFRKNRYGLPAEKPPVRLVSELPPPPPPEPSKVVPGEGRRDRYGQPIKPVVQTPIEVVTQEAVEEAEVIRNALREMTLEELLEVSGSDEPLEVEPVVYDEETQAQMAWEAEMARAAAVPAEETVVKEKAKTTLKSKSKTKKTSATTKKKAATKTSKQQVKSKNKQKK